MEGFEKIQLDTQIKPSRIKDFASQQPMPSRKKIKFNLSPRNNLILLGIIIFLVLFGVFGIFLPAKKTYSQARVLQTHAQAALWGLKSQNIDVASSELENTQTELKKTQDDLHAMVYLKFIPPFLFYYNDADHLLNAAGYGLNAGQIFVDAIKPYADVLGFKGSGTFAGGSAQQRIQTAVTTMSKVTPKLDDIEAQLVLARQEIDQVNPNHYPPIFAGKKVRDQLSQVKTIADEGTTFIEQAKPLIKVLPVLLGEPTEKKYLVIFQNDKELRPTGGFMTSYAIFSLSHGVIKVDSTNDIYTLDASIGNHPAAPRPILQYLPKVYQWNLRDTNISPDFLVSMDNFNKMYKIAGGYVPVDGIIAIDTHTFIAAMQVLGDMTVDGTTFTTKTDPRCNCPQAIYQMEAITDTPVNYVKSDRKGIIGDLMYAIMQKAFSSSPKLYWGPLFQTMIAEVSQKHILFDIYNSDAANGLDALNATGRILPFDGDYLHINDTNFGGAKSNLFITQSVDQNYKVNGDGSIEKTVTINYKNPFAPSDCNLERGGLCLNAVQRDWLRLYVPKGSKIVSSSGSEVKITTYDELGKTVFEGFLTVRPLGAATFAITYDLPFKVAGGSPLPLMIQKQGGTDNQQYTISVNGHQVQSFQLLTDQTLKLNVR